VPFQQLTEYLEARYKPLQKLGDRIRSVDSEAGLTTTEIAVLSFLLVGIAVAIGATLLAAAQGNADRIDDITPPDFSAPVDD